MDIPERGAISDSTSFSHLSSSSVGPALVATGGLMVLGAGLAFLGPLAIIGVTVEAGAGGFITGTVISAFGFSSGMGLVSLGIMDTTTGIITENGPAYRQSMLDQADLLEQMGDIDGLIVENVAQQVGETISPGSGHVASAEAKLFYDGAKLFKLISEAPKSSKSRFDLLNRTLDTLTLKKTVESDAAKLDRAKSEAVTGKQGDAKAPKSDAGKEQGHDDRGRH